VDIRLLKGIMEGDADGQGRWPEPYKDEVMKVVDWNRRKAGIRTVCRRLEPIRNTGFEILSVIIMRPVSLRS
jgi:hypothetical protein